MPPDEQELSYLWDMQDAAKEINSFMRGVKFAKFEKTKVLRNKHPEIPWTKFIRMRNVIAHEYGETLISRVWVAATESVPELIETLKDLLAE